ncbi:MAG: hypothetical protein JWR44_1729 [Hymenobacter sp.]|nr:hypothetical protein [Hymenobacter sp.]
MMRPSTFSRQACRAAVPTAQRVARVTREAFSRNAPTPPDGTLDESTDIRTLLAKEGAVSWDCCLRHVIRDIEAYGDTPPEPGHAARQVALVRATIEQVMADLRVEFPEQL